MIDTATITVKAGNGGDGLVSFRREKYIPKGGPWGGDGGTGGSIYFYVDPNINTLTQFRRQRKYEAGKGMPGMTNRKKGKDGDDLTIHVPAGTVVKNAEGKTLYDLTKPGETVLIQEGGQGGLGNWHFKSSVNRTPMQATDGKKTETLELNLELKLIADIGIIGLPSSGKSTLLNSLARTDVKTAEYHFTTLEPNIGVLKTSELLGQGYEDLVIADIPGIIEGAAEGKGLGHDFLRHIQRTKVLVHLLDGSAATLISPEEITNHYTTIQNELKKWDEELENIEPGSPNLMDKPQIVAVNKIDITEVRDLTDEIKNKFEKEFNISPYFVSAATKEGIPELMKEVVETYNKHKEIEKKQIEKEAAAKTDEINKFDINNLPNKRIVFRSPKENPLDIEE